MLRPIVFVLAFSSVSAFAQLEVGGDLLDNCAEIDALNDAGDFAGARAKAQLCLEGIDQQLSGEVSSFFHEEIGGWTRSNIETSQAMGFTNISAVYEKDGDQVNVSLTSTSGGSSSLGGLIGGFAQSAFGGGGGGQRVTVAGIGSTMNPDGSLMVPLEGGAFLSFDSPSFNNADDALEGMGDLINEFPVADINQALM